MRFVLDLTVHLIPSEPVDMAAEGLEEATDLKFAFEADLAPFPGLRIQFPMRETLDEERYHRLMSAAPEVVTGVFSIDSVCFQVEHGRCVLRCYDSYDTAAGYRSAIEQLVIGYGFVRESL